MYTVIHKQNVAVHYVIITPENLDGF